MDSNKKIKYRPFMTSFNSLMMPVFACVAIASCSPVDVPMARNLSVPSPALAAERQESVNEKPDSVIYLPLGSDVLIPKAANSGNSLPTEIVGPFELRSETIAGALQLIMADYEIPMAFETDEGFERTVTVTNLRGPLDNVVNKICGLADLYCSYEDGLLVVKETQTFTVAIPPIGGEGDDILANIASGVEAITGSKPITEASTRTIIYEATNRTSELVERYFQRVRASTALIIFEVYIWEVSLNNGNSAGIDWQGISKFGRFASGINISGSTGADFNPISIGLPTKGGVSYGSDDVLEFISEYGAVKTISQPQITVLSGAEATLRAADTINYVSSLVRTITTNGQTAVSTETATVDTGFTLKISSNWDNATVYGTIDINLEEFKGFKNFDADGTILQLPETTERELSTQIRIRPGDSVLIAGLVRESDEYDKSGAGFDSPIVPISRTLTTTNTEMVFLLKPRVIVYTSEMDKIRSVSTTKGNDKLPDDTIIQYPISIKSE